MPHQMLYSYYVRTTKQIVVQQHFTIEKIKLREFLNKLLYFTYS